MQSQAQFRRSPLSRARAVSEPAGRLLRLPQADGAEGAIFERRNIEEYIAQNGSDPVTGEELSVDDLIEIKTPRSSKPRPPTLTSIPSLLQAFQNEWDALALESFNLKQQLSETRQ